MLKKQKPKFLAVIPSNMKIKRTMILPMVAASMLMYTQANAAPIVQTVGNLDWNAAVWGAGPDVPTGGNDYVTATAAGDTVRTSADGGNSTFLGDSITVVAGTRALMKTEDSTSTVDGNFTLDGGLLVMGPSNPNVNGTLDVTNFIVTGTGSHIAISVWGRILTIDGILTGSGNLLIYYSNSQSDNGGDRIIKFSSVGDYTGTITLTENLTLDFDSDSTFVGGLIIDATSQLNVDQVLTFYSGSLVANSVPIADGEYTGATLDALGSNFTNSGGTVKVVGPPAGTLIMIQ
jgi:hypothetical protein